MDNKAKRKHHHCDEFVAEFTEDGHTFAVTMNLPFLLPYLGQRLPFDPTAELVPVGAVSVEQLVLVVSPRLGARSLAEWVDKVERNSAGAGFGTFGQGSIAHVLASQIAWEMNVALVIAHYRGVAPASGRAIPLAVTGAKRVAVLS